METLFTEKQINERVNRMNFYDGTTNGQPKTVRSEIKLVTPEMAKNWLTTNIKNRNVSDTLVNHYARQMKLGLWELTGEPLIFSSNKLLDGQHRLHALIKAEVSLEFLCVFNVNDSAFAVMGTGKTRSAGDIFSITDIKNANNMAAGIRKYYTLISKSSLTTGTPRGGRIISSSGNGLVNIKSTAKEFINFYFENKDFLDDVMIKSQSMYKKSRLFACSELVGYISYLYFEKKHSYTKIIEFFDGVSGGKTDNSIILILRDKLLSDKISIKRIPGNIRTIFIIKTWNAFITGKYFKLLKYDQERDIKPEFI